MSDGVQYGIDGILGLIVAIGGGVLNAMRTDQREIRDDHEKMVRELPATYARRDDVKEALARLEGRMDAQHSQINAKLDRLIERR